VLDTTFDRDHIAAVRREIREQADRHGMNDEEINDFVTAANEIMTNAVRHGSRTSTLRLLRDGKFVCEVRDTGPGFITTPFLHPRNPPTPSPAGGLGLWIAQQIGAELSIRSGPSGTLVSITAATATEQQAPDHR
jgi:anti-sigma regulatory factor (Ser/Thr protein kinase)